jgi:hypothetical protein
MQYFVVFKTTRGSAIKYFDENENEKTRAKNADEVFG